MHEIELETHKWESSQRVLQGNGVPMSTLFVIRLEWIFIYSWEIGSKILFSLGVTDYWFDEEPSTNKSVYQG